MHRPSFTEFPLVAAHIPGERTHRKLVGGSCNRITVNDYLSWLRQMGAEYEVRKHSRGYYLVKSNISKIGVS